MPPSPHSGGAAVVAPLLARVGPRAAMRGLGCPHPPRNAQKIRTAPRRVPHGPWGRASRGVAWRVLRPPGLTPHIPPRHFCLCWFWVRWASPPSAATGLPRKQGGRGIARLGPSAVGGCFPRSVFFPPASSWPSPVPFRRGWWLSAPAPHWARRAAPAARRGGRHGIQKVVRVGSPNGRRKDRAGSPAARHGPIPCATSFAIERVSPCRRSGRTASKPAPGSRRRGTGAHREP